jgi:hypothetical protein
MPYHQRLAVLAHYAGKTDKEIDPSDNGFLRVMRYRALQQIRREVGLVERKPGKQELLRAQVAEANRAAAA